MKLHGTRFGMLRAMVALGCLSTCWNAGAQALTHELVCALSFTGNQIFTFWSDDPGSLLQTRTVSGLQAGERVLGLDYWGNQIYGLGSQSRLYLLDPSSGQATAVNSSRFNPGLAGSTFGFGNTPGGTRVVSELDINQNICRTTGRCSLDPILQYAAGDPFAGTSPNVTSVAYDKLTDTLYALDYMRRSLAAMNPDTGLLTTLTPAGLNIDVSRYNGFAISEATGTAYLGFAPGSGGTGASLYTLDLTSGQARLVGLIGGVNDGVLVRGLTVVPGAQSLADLRNFSVVPEPGTSTLLVVGGAIGFSRALRRRNTGLRQIAFP